MRVRITAVAALAGSLFLAPVMMGQANATVPDLKGVFGTTDGDVTLVRHGGGGHGGGGMRGGGGGRHFGGMGGGGRHFSGGGRHGGHFARGGGGHHYASRGGGRHIGRVGGGRHYASRSWDGGKHVRHGGGRQYAWNDGPGSGMAATMDEMTAITSTSSAGTATSIIALFRSESAGGPATIATGMAMVGARGCIARLCIPEAPIGGTDTTPARATPTTDGLHTMHLGIMA